MRDLIDQCFLRLDVRRLEWSIVPVQIDVQESLLDKEAELLGRYVRLTQDDMNFVQVKREPNGLLEQMDKLIGHLDWDRMNRCSVIETIYNQSVLHF